MKYNQRPSRGHTCADVDDMVEGVHALDDVHHQVGEAHVVLHDQRVDGLRLHHVVHQVEPLGVLQAALRQPVVGAAVIDGAALERGEEAAGGVGGRIGSD